jgi:hypothetical protein
VQGSEVNECVGYSNAWDTHLEKTRVEVEDITRVRLTSRRAAEQQRHLTVGNSLLRQVIEDDERVHLVVTVVLANRGTSVRCEVLERSGIRCRRADNRAVLERVTVLCA